MVKQRRGFTLVEALVYCTLLALFATIFFLALPTRSNASAENLSRSVELGSVAVSKLSSKIANSAAGKVVLQNKGQTLVVLTATNEKYPQFSYDSSGGLLWRQWEYFAFESGKIRHIIQPFTSPKLKDSVIAPSELLGSQKVNGKVFASHVKTFAVTQVPEGYLMRIELQADGSSFAIQTLASPRNL